MLGEQIGTTTGKRLVRRVLSTEPPTAEVSFEDSGTLLGVAVTGMGTYTSVIGADGSLHGDGQGMEMTADGEAVTWKGTAVGKFRPRRLGELPRNALLPHRFAKARQPQQLVRRLRIRRRRLWHHRFQNVGMEMTVSPGT